jgi:acyl transferase domain-containing protein
MFWLLRCRTSNVHGGWLDPADITPSYWGQHITGTVRFAENVASVGSWRPTVRAFVSLN